MKEDELRWFGKIFGSEFRELRLVIVSDLHYGNPLFSMKHLERTLEFIKANDDVYCALNGDLLETATRTSKGNVYKQTKSPTVQRDDIIDLLKPIKEKILGMTTGNHELRVAQDSDSDFSRDISRALSVPYRPEGMLYKLVFGNGNNRVKGKPYTFKGYWTHGYGGARTKGGKAVKAERLAAFVVCDFYAMSHDHDVNVAPYTTLDMDERGMLSKEYPGFITGSVTAKRAMLIKTNAYLKWGNYAEMGGFSPTDLVTPVIMLLTPSSDYWAMIPDKPQKAVKVIV
jgi:hypothetical protein